MAGEIGDPCRRLDDRAALDRRHRPRGGRRQRRRSREEREEGPAGGEQAAARWPSPGPRQGGPGEPGGAGAAGDGAPADAPEAPGASPERGPPQAVDREEEERSSPAPRRPPSGRAAPAGGPGRARTAAAWPGPCARARPARGARRSGGASCQEPLQQPVEMVRPLLARRRVAAAVVEARAHAPLHALDDRLVLALDAVEAGAGAAVEP